MNLVQLFKRQKKNSWRYHYYPEKNSSRPKLVSLLRVRNEELLLPDTLAHLAGISDAIVAFDDASTDGTFELLRAHPKVLAIIQNEHWLSDPTQRVESETSHRQGLLDLARKFKPEWIFCNDADERYLGDIKGFVRSPESAGVAAVRVSLFDAYLTASDQKPYTSRQPLLDLRQSFGPERRDIIMLWRDTSLVNFQGLDAREPTLSAGARVIVQFYCQHYGKSLSVEHWEETCDYYSRYMPEPYASKWSARKGKAIHTQSDQGSKLYRWGTELFKHAQVIHPLPAITA